MNTGRGPDCGAGEVVPQNAGQGDPNANHWSACIYHLVFNENA
jgi:hypothetical protein